ncbi:hypothetical protein HanRHA438_Chr15g0684131 [Helianthus annuus]|nr:hypothetical protein HanIR_Chr15g0730021 [Helianthus annuus]KAJ0842765.1 hypothetical protein HanRHA438_Chr15g0684131 [Helianthus annuus]
MRVLVRSNDENNTAEKWQKQRPSPTPLWAVADASCFFSLLRRPIFLSTGFLSYGEKTKSRRRRPVGPSPTASPCLGC